MQFCNNPSYCELPISGMFLVPYSHEASFVTVGDSFTVPDICMIDNNNNGIFTERFGISIEKSYNEMQKGKNKHCLAKLNHIPSRINN